MGQGQKAAEKADIDAAAPSEAGGTGKKPYAAPVLIEYGSVAKLTQGSRTRNNDGSNTRKRKRACL